MSEGWTRRAALGVGGVGLVSAGFWTWLRERGYAVDPPPSSMEGEPAPVVLPLSGPPFDLRALAVLEPLLETLLPGGLGLPSAVEAGVLTYFERAGRLPGLRPVRDDVLKLTRHLDREATRRSSAGFASLDAAERTQILLAVGDDHEGRGRFVPARALETTLRFALEGYLGHPHHGGNRAFASWDALRIPMPRDRSPSGHAH